MQSAVAECCFYRVQNSWLYSLYPAIISKRQKITVFSHFGGSGYLPGLHGRTVGNARWTSTRSACPGREARENDRISADSVLTTGSQVTQVTHILWPLYFASLASLPSLTVQWSTSHISHISQILRLQILRDLRGMRDECRTTISHKCSYCNSDFCTGRKCTLIATLSEDRK